MTDDASLDEDLLARAALARAAYALSLPEHPERLGDYPFLAA